MKKNCDKIAIFLLIATLLMFSLLGCKAKEKIEQVEEKNASGNIVVGEVKENVSERGEVIADNVVDLIGIEDATAIIFNDMAIVAIELAEGNEWTEEMRKTIENTVYETDNKVKSVLVTREKAIFNKIDDIAQLLLKGEKLDKHSSEINKIIKRINTVSKQ